MMLQNIYKIFIDFCTCIVLGLHQFWYLYRYLIIVTQGFFQDGGFPPWLGFAPSPWKFFDSESIQVFSLNI